MIGVAILYTNPQQFEDLCGNIRETCGRECQIAGIDNRSGEYDIFSAYELLTKQMHTDIMVFCHQDISFHSADWGVLLEKYFAENSDLGCVGVAGGSAHSRSPGGWMTGASYCKRYINIIQHVPGKKSMLDRSISTEKALYPVVAVDGVFMAFRRSVFEKVSFGRSNLSGYHGYDLDISLQLLRNGWKIAVSSEILLEHFSAGSYFPQYIFNVETIHLKNKDILPVFAEETPKSQWELRKYETQSLLFFAYTMRQAGVSGKVFRKIVWRFAANGTFFCKYAILLLAEVGRSLVFPRYH